MRLWVWNDYSSALQHSKHSKVCLRLSSSPYSAYAPLPTLLVLYLQLEMTMESSEVPHHISSEPLSELTYCIYLARVLPKEVRDLQGKGCGPWTQEAANLLPPLQVLYRCLLPSLRSSPAAASSPSLRSSPDASAPSLSPENILGVWRTCTPHRPMIASPSCTATLPSSSRFRV